MSTEFHISPGTRITGATRKGICRVGAIAFDSRNNQIFGLSARHVLECEEAPDLIEPASGEKIGERIGAVTGWLDRIPFHNSIGMFRIDRDQFKISMATSFISIRGLTRPDKLLGATVFKLDDSSELSKGTVTGLGGAVRFVNPYNHHSTLMTDVIEMRFAEGGPDPVAAGEAGSLLVDERDAAVGLIICGRRERCFAAPLAAFLEARNLHLADDRTSIAFGIDESPESYVSELRYAKSGGQRMLRDLLSEPRLHADPGGDDVPADLLKDLEAT